MASQAKIVRRISDRVPTGLLTLLVVIPVLSFLLGAATQTPHSSASRWWALAGLLALAFCFWATRAWRSSSVGPEPSELREKLAIEEEWLRLTLESTDAAPYDWNPLTESEFFSPRLYELLGYEPGKVKSGSTGALAHIHPDDRARITSEWTSTMLGAISSYDRQYQLRKKNGEFLCVRDRGRVITRDHAGKATRIAGCVCDVSRQRLAEESFRDSEARYRDLVETARDFIFTCDTEGHFAQVKAAMVRQLGYSNVRLQ